VNLYEIIDKAEDGLVPLVVETKETNRELAAALRLVSVVAGSKAVMSCPALAQHWPCFLNSLSLTLNWILLAVDQRDIAVHTLHELIPEIQGKLDIFDWETINEDLALLGG